MSDPISVLLSPDDTLRGYDRWAAQYDDGDNPMIAATTWALDARPPALAGARVLELGCGTGRHAARVLAGGASAYVGVDGSDGMLAIARARAADPRCTWVGADVAADASLPIATGGFDLALIVLVLEHVRDLAPLFGSAARALAPGGALRLIELHPDRVAAGTVAHFHDAAAGGGEIRFTSVAHPVAAITRALADAGLDVERVDEHLADGALLAAAPRLAKHRGRRVLLELSARRRQTPRPAR